MNWPLTTKDSRGAKNSVKSSDNNCTENTQMLFSRKIEKNFQNHNSEPASKIVKIVVFETSISAKIDFTENLSGRKISKSPHCLSDFMYVKPTVAN